MGKPILLHHPLIDIHIDEVVAGITKENMVGVEDPITLHGRIFKIIFDMHHPLMVFRNNHPFTPAK